MKRKIWIFISVFVIASLALTGIAAVNVAPATTTVECPAGSIEPCDIFSGSEKDVRYYLQGYVLDYDNSVTDPQQWMSYQGGAFAPVFMEKVYQGSFSEMGGYIPDKIRLPLAENVGIPQLGFANQKGTIVRYVPIKATLESVGNLDRIWVTSFADPITELYTNMLGNEYTTYWWAEEDKMLVYTWTLTQEGDQLVIDISSITLEWFPNTEPRVAGNVLTDMSKRVSPQFLNLQRGEPLEVVNLFESKVFWSDPSKSHWVVEYNYVAYVELKRADGSTFIVPTEDWEGTHDDTDITNGCKARYRPYIGETMYVSIARSFLEIEPRYPARPLRDDEISQFKERLDEGTVDLMHGTVFSERYDGRDYYVTLQKEDGTLVEFRAYEWQVPPVGTKVVFYVYNQDPTGLIGTKEADTDKWWYVEVREAIWSTCGE